MEWCCLCLVLLALSAVSANAADPYGNLPKDKNGFITTYQLYQAGWKVWSPPYPATAAMHHEEGTVYLSVKTNAAGKIATVVIQDQPESTKFDDLRQNTLGYARNNWTLAPNTTLKVKVRYRYW